MCVPSFLLEKTGQRYTVFLKVQIFYGKNAKKSITLRLINIK